MSDLDEILFETLTDEKLTQNERYQQVNLILKRNQKSKEAKFPEKFCLDIEYYRFTDREIYNYSMPGLAARRNDLETVRLLMENGYSGQLVLEQTLYTAIYKSYSTDIIRYLLTLNPQIEANIKFDYRDGLFTNCLKVAESKKDLKSVDSYIKLKKALATSLALPPRAKKITSDKKSESNEKKSNPVESKPISATYKDVLSDFMTAVQLDSLFVIQYLARCLQKINIGEATEEQYPVLDKMTVQLFEIFNDEDYPDAVAYQQFKDILLPEWLAYESTSEGYFAEKEEKSVANKLEFMKRLFKGEHPAANFAEYKEEMGLIPEEDGTLEEKKSILKLSQMPQTLHHNHSPLPKPGKDEKSQPKDYIDSFLKMDSGLKKVHLDGYKDFAADEIAQSVTLLADSLGIKNEFKFCFSYPGSQADDREFIPKLQEILKDSLTRYIPIVCQTRESTHATACVIDKVERKIFVVDPERDRQRSETELVNHMKKVQSIIKDGFEKFEIIQATPDRHRVQGNVPQGPDDHNNCGIYTAIIILAVLLKQEKIPLKSIHPEVQRVLDSLDIDVAAGKLPRSEYLQSYIGILLLACEDFRMSRNEKLRKNLF